MFCSENTIAHALISYITTLIQSGLALNFVTLLDHDL